MRHLILLPGLLNDAELWRDQVRALSPAIACQVADITQGDTLRQLAEQVLADAPPHFALAGFSLGGFVAQEIVRIAPDRVLPTGAARHVDPRGHAGACGETPGFERGGPGQRHIPRIRRPVADRYLAPEHLNDEAIVHRIRSMTARLGPEVFVRQNSLERRDGTDLLRSLTCPVLILCGEQDAITPVADHREMAALVPQAKLVIVPGSGHMTPLEQPGLVTNALCEWLGLERD